MNQYEAALVLNESEKYNLDELFLALFSTVAFVQEMRNGLWDAYCIIAEMAADKDRADMLMDVGTPLFYLRTIIRALDRTQDPHLRRLKLIQAPKQEGGDR